MPLYNCKKCDYKTSHKGHYDKHIASWRHNNIKCKACGNVYSINTSMSKHNSICSAKLLKEKDSIIKDKDNIIKEKDVLLEKKDVLLEAKNKTIKVRKVIATQTTIALEYLRKYLPNAPTITEMDTSALKYDESKENAQFVMYANKFKNKELHIYVGDLIINQYVKANPNDQSIWNVTKNQNKFIVHRVINQYKKSWERDDNLVAINKNIIDPAIKTMKDGLDLMIKSLLDQCSGNKPKAYMGDFGSCYDEMINIDNYVKNSIFKKDIIGHIKNSFLFNQETIDNIINNI